MSGSLLLRKVGDWVDQHLLFIVAGFLIAFIPLYPKIPLFQPIDGYIVRVRLEDILVLVAASIWLMQLFRARVKLLQPLSKLMALYIVVGLVSLLHAFFWLKSVPLVPAHILKSVLHLLRYLEYFSLFFIVSAAVTTRKHLVMLVMILFCTLFVVSAYGYGQKYHQWPVYSTMSREFSRGIPLQLANSYARVQSTFAGHYDFAVFVSLLLPLVLVFLVSRSSPFPRWFTGEVLIAGIWALMVSALRIALIAYVVSSVVVLALYFWRSEASKKWLRLMLATVSLGLVTLGMMLLFGGNLAHLLIKGVYGVFGQQVMTTEQSILPQYQLPIPQHPSDLQQPEVGEVEVVTVTEAGEVIVEYKKASPSFSECSRTKELSLCIRLDSLWPQAIQGFTNSPLVGSGYATLNKQNFLHLAEADGTDNNFLRTLGETGLLGFVSFYAVIGYVAWTAWKAVRIGDQLNHLIVIGYLGAVVSILICALLIDVFAASKVAFTFWALTALMISSTKMVSWSND